MLSFTESGLLATYSKENLSPHGKFFAKPEFSNNKRNRVIGVPISFVASFEVYGFLQQSSTPGPAFHGASRSTHIFKRMDNLGASPNTVKWLQTNDLSSVFDRISAEHFGGLPGSGKGCGPGAYKKTRTRLCVRVSI